ncbi:MAG: ribonuclease H family protein [Bacteroidetes bacterium]|nr:ribonuclease H family protein [Bacteroidota bacterium]
MAKSKFYVVWIGKKPGIYSSWDDCKAQVEGYEGAKYKGFATKELAEAAFHDDHEIHMKKDLSGPKKIVCSDPRIGIPDPDSISVDAACKGNPGILEYRGVDTKSGAQLFRQGPFPEGTINIGEFLAIVHALALLKKIDSDWPIYSDSKTAIKWVTTKSIKTNLKRSAQSAQLFALVDRALIWLKENSWKNPVLKWETRYWGEVPADFGRK